MLTRSVSITALEDKPLSIKAGDFNLQDKVTYRIEETEKGKEFEIVFTNRPQPAGRFIGALQLMTNYDDKPEINISIIGKFSKNTEDNEKRQ